MAKSKKTNETSKTPKDSDDANSPRIHDDEVTQAPNVENDSGPDVIEDAVEIAADHDDDPVRNVSSEHTSEPDENLSDAIDTDEADIAKEPSMDVASDVDDSVTSAEDVVQDDVAENVADPQTYQTVAAAPAESRSIFFPLVLGGLVAAFLGFLVGQEGLLFQRPYVPDHTEAVNALRGDVDILQQDLSDLSDQIKAIPGPVDLAPIESALANIDDRLTELERRPVPTQGDTPDFSGAFEGALDDFSGAFDELKSQSEAQQAEIARLLDETAQARSNAAEGEKFILARAAIAQVRAAFDAGQPFVDPLDDLEAVGLVEIPDILKDTAADGITTMANLQTQAPDAARAALSAARAENRDGEGVGGFLQRQLGIRSLSPQEGDDPDSVLSRIEAAINDNRLSDALTEVELLPDGARAALGDWLSHAQTRASAVSAVETLLQSLPTN